MLKGMFGVRTPICRNCAVYSSIAVHLLFRHVFGVLWISGWASLGGPWHIYRHLLTGLTTKKIQMGWNHHLVIRRMKLEDGGSFSLFPSWSVSWVLEKSDTLPAGLVCKTQAKLLLLAALAGANRAAMIELDYWLTGDSCWVLGSLRSLRCYV